MAHPEFTIAYASGATASFASTNPARWVMALGAGTVVLTNAGDAANDGSTSTATLVLTTNQIVPGEWTALVSTSCSSILLGSTSTPPPSPISSVLPLNLGGGSNYVSGILPASNVQSYITDASTHTSAFSATIGYAHMINPSGATFAYTLPAVTSKNDGMKIAVINVSTGSTATVAAPTGSDNVGNSAGTATGATAAGPTGGNTKVYCADVSVLAWLVGI
jgi:hypothetical protein